jgi:hypothetical protein
VVANVGTPVLCVVPACHDYYASLMLCVLQGFPNFPAGFARELACVDTLRFQLSISARWRTTLCRTAIQTLLLTPPTHLSQFHLRAADIHTHHLAALQHNSAARTRELGYSWR